MTGSCSIATLLDKTPGFERSRKRCAVARTLRDVA
jgi:hypothetical protein